MPQGSLYFTVRTADSAFPVPEARVTVFSPDGTVLGEDRISGNSGISREFFIEAPARSLSLRPEEEQPYSTCDARIEADGFYTFFVRGIQIFAGEKSVLPAEMIPRGQSEDEVLEYEIGPHALRTTPENRIVGPSEDERVLREVFIPERVTVHLGTPTSSASNVTVPFVDYIKNVASSEIYPTWPEASLRANIYCQISFILNRVFTEWYPSRGYNFNITNSTAYDQYYVYGRNIFESISRIVDEIFNEYVRRPGRIDPYFTEYCNGTTVTCAGLSQWGTVTLAQNGRSPLEILQFYYGDVELTSTNKIRAIQSSYPGSPLRRGSSGRDVRTIQQQLNRIRVNYPAIPAINTVDGIYGTETENAVKAFQRIFDLTPDGVVGKRTWYRISYIYVAVKRLGELNSEGERPQYDDNSYPGLLRFGDTGTAVQNLQFYLKTIAAFNPFISDLEIDGFFGRGTENSVRAFQRTYSLNVDGIVGETTWNRIVSVYLDVTEGGTLTIRPYPGQLLRIGSSGDSVLYEQMLLNRIRPVFVTVGKLEEDGVFGPRMRNSVREFQRLFGYRDDGIIGRETWNALNRVFGSTVSGCFDNLPAVSGRVLQYGSEGSDVAALQNQLNRIGSALTPIPTLRADGAFGRRTQEAVTVFQRIFGLTADGVVGTATRTRIASIERAVNAGCFPSSTRQADSVLPRSTPVQEVEWKQEFLSRNSGMPAVAAEPLTLGSEGETVEKMKQALEARGFLNPRAREEGSFFGPSTARAVLAFQEEKGLTPTSVADEATLKMLFEP
ncbi:MAG: hypothetical protein E7580_00565 [Ruminococcaceae bacterium]|nr:hypothetical protein [Oscillospiraceae bacterium]